MLGHIKSAKCNVNQVAEFWCFFILMYWAGKDLNWGCLKQVLLYFLWAAYEGHGLLGKLHTREELLQQIMESSDCRWESYENIQKAKLQIDIFPLWYLLS
jgi:hypothetical protein